MDSDKSEKRKLSEHDDGQSDKRARIDSPMHREMMAKSFYSILEKLSGQKK
jgi:hypothetical protein